MKKIIASVMILIVLIPLFTGCRAVIDEDAECTWSAWEASETKKNKTKFVSVCADCGKEREYTCSYSKGLMYEENEDGTLSVAGIGSCKDTFLYIGGEYNGKKVTSISSNAFNGNTEIKYVYVGEGIKTVADHAFIANFSLLCATLSEGVEKLGIYAFYECISMYDVIIPETLTEIEDYTFSGCFALRKISLHDGITMIGKGAYSRCESVKEFTLPKGTKTLSEHTFDACNNLERVDLTGAEGSIPESFFAACSSMRSFEIPRGITLIETKAFIGCTGLEELYIPDTVTAIEVRDGESPFYMCDEKKLTVKCEGVKSGDNWNEGYDICNYIEYDGGEKPTEAVKLTFLFGMEK